MITNEQIKWARTRAGLSVTQFAQLLGVKPKKLTDWELGWSSPPEKIERKIRKIADRMADAERSVGCFRGFQLGHVQLRNRLVFPAMVTCYTDDLGLVTPRAIEHYRAIARGGVGLVTLEATSVNQERKLAGLGIWNDAQVPILKGLVEVIHAEEAAVCIQIADGLRFTGKTPEDLSAQEVEAIIEEFVAGVLRAFTAGADAVELHGAHSYTLADFLSRRSNHRRDSYGGAVQCRVEIVRQIIARVRERCDEPNIIGVRINGEEFIVGGNTLRDACGIASLLEDAGANFIHVSAGARHEDGADSYSMHRCEPPAEFPDAANIHLAEAVKQMVGIPVIGVGKIPTTGLATRLIEQGKCDLVAMCRAILADYDLPNKERAGAPDQVRRCIYCNKCLEAIWRGEPTSCVLWREK